MKCLACGRECEMNKSESWWECGLQWEIFKRCRLGNSGWWNLPGDKIYSVPEGCLLVVKDEEV